MAEEMPKIVNTKEDVEKYREEVMSRKLEEGEGYLKNRMRYVKIEKDEDGSEKISVYAQPFMVKTLSLEEKKRREAEKQKKRDEISKEGAKYGLDPIAENESIREYKKRLSAKKAEAKNKEKRDEVSKEGAKYGLEPMKDTESFKEYREKINSAKKKDTLKKRLQEQEEKMKQKQKELEEKKKELE